MHFLYPPPPPPTPTPPASSGSSGTSCTHSFCSLGALGSTLHHDRHFLPSSSKGRISRTNNLHREQPFSGSFAFRVPCAVQSEVQKNPIPSNFSGFELAPTPTFFVITSCTPTGIRNRTEVLLHHTPNNIRRYTPILI